MTWLIAVWIVCGIFSSIGLFRRCRSITLKKPLFSEEEIAEWNRKFLPGDIFFGGFLGFLLGPVGILIVLLSPE